MDRDSPRTRMQDVEVIPDRMPRSLRDGEPDRPWHSPGVYSVAPGVFRIPLPLPDEGLHSVNVYVLRDADGVVLIDSGQATTACREHLERGLGALGLGLRDVRTVLVTHIHRDHYTQAVTLRREFDSGIRLGRDERPSLRLLTDPSRHTVQTQLVMLRECGAESVEAQNADLDDGLPASVWEEPDAWLDPGPVRLATRTLQGVPTPGHTRGHMVFRDATAGLLFAGDHVLPHITPSIGFEPASSASPLADYLRSLHLVRSLPDTWLLPAHGHPTRSVHDRVDELLAHHADRLEATAIPASSQEVTALEVAGLLSWTRRHRTLSDLSPFNRMLAVLETKAHLDLLVHRGRLRSCESDGVRRYAAA